MTAVQPEKLLTSKHCLKLLWQRDHFAGVMPGAGHLCSHGVTPGKVPAFRPGSTGTAGPRRRAGTCGGQEALGERLPQLHLRYCTHSWNDADGLERVQRRTRNVIKELEGMIYMASLKGLHNSNNNKRSQHIVFFIFVPKRS